MGINFKEILHEAKKFGYAETNPKSDLNGDDVSSKIRILSSLCFHTLISENNILDEVVASDASSESYLIKGDYVNPIGENKQFEAGFRISQDDDITDYRVFDNENNVLTEDLNQSNLFQYKEQINAL